MYTWNDGRVYEGYWYGGKQHGLGIYYNPRDGSTKAGLWEDGKRIEWFTEDEVVKINNGSFNYYRLFQKADSHE